MVDEDEETSSFSVEVGRRLRALRRTRHLSLDDVERVSAGRWTASAVGAYERGFRNLSLPRLRDLAAFYDVPMSALLGEADRDIARVGHAGNVGNVVLDLDALRSLGDDDAVAVTRYLQSIVHERCDFNGRVLSIRRDDVRALCAITQTDESRLYDLLRAWNALVAAPAVESADGAAAGS